jgi:succinate dehydrogenase/fumarate reductase flavoprotein subunit
VISRQELEEIKMAREMIADKVVETDVLVIGGGIVGCTAAWKAAEHGLNVALIEKSKPERSGKTGQGLDEVGIFPGRDGTTTLDALKLYLGGRGPASLRAASRVLDPNVLYNIFDNALWALDELERMGVNMRYVDGEFGWMPYGFTPDGEPGPMIELRVHWHNVKPEMAAAIRKKGVKVFERTMVVDLLTNNGRVTGATAVNNRTGEFIVFKAKAVVLGTGDFSRHYNPSPPPCWKYKMAYNNCPASAAGDGHAVAYRAGADITRTETMQPAIVRDEILLQPGQFYLNDGITAKMFTWTGKELSFRPGGPLEYLEYLNKGLAPLYQTLEHLPDDFQKRLEIHIMDETPLRLKLHEDRGFNPGKHRYQMAGNRGSHVLSGGIVIDDNFQTTLKGVYAGGECSEACGIGAGGASTAGMFIGENIHRYVSAAPEPKIDEAQVENQKRTALAPLSVKDGTVPMELECTIRSICEEFAGPIKTEGMLREGLRRLGSLRRIFLPRLMAVNPHYLMRCLEVRNILDLAEVHFKASLERKETRSGSGKGQFFRLDYPKADPSLDNKHLCVRMEDGKTVIEVKEVPYLKPEYAKEKK